MDGYLRKAHANVLDLVGRDARCGGAFRGVHPLAATTSSLPVFESAAWTDPPLMVPSAVLFWVDNMTLWLEMPHRSLGNLTPNEHAGRHARQASGTGWLRGAGHPRGTSLRARPARRTCRARTAVGRVSSSPRRRIPASAANPGWSRASRSPIPGPGPRHASSRRRTGTLWPPRPSPARRPSAAASAYTSSGLARLPRTLTPGGSGAGNGTSASTESGSTPSDARWSVEVWRLH
jgi:hypothetical protein